MIFRQPGRGVARKLYATRLKGRKFGGARLIGPDGEIVEEVWLGWRAKSCKLPPPIVLTDKPSERIAAD